MLNTLIEKLHASPYKVGLAATGCGAGVQSLLFNVAGASNTIIDCRFPYSTYSLTGLIKYTPTQFVCQNTADRMAIAMCDSIPCTHYNLGVGVTGALLTNRIKKGACRAFISVCNKVSHITYRKELQLDTLLTRESQEQFVCEETVKLLCEAAGIIPSKYIGFTCESCKREFKDTLLECSECVAWAQIKQLPIGTKVQTPYGIGVIQSYSLTTHPIVKCYVVSGLQLGEWDKPVFYPDEVTEVL